MAQNDGLANANTLGDLVPVLHPPNGKGHVPCRELVLLLDNLNSKAAANAYKQWQVGWDESEAPAHVCVAQLADKTVGVLKVARDGACTFFVRLNRPHANQIADRDKMSRDRPRAFSRKLSIAEAFGILRSARPYCLKEGEVHHPHALSLLCSMTRKGSLSFDIAETPQAVRSCTLVALTPLSRVVEQCLLLMGWKAAYTTHDEALWTAQAVDEKVWGKTHGDMFVGDVASKFADAARELSACANPALFAELVPQVNSHDQAAAVALDVVQRFLHRSDAFATGQPALVPAPPPAPSPAASGAEVDMAPSDEDEEPPPPPPPSKPAPVASAKPAEKPTPAPRSRPRRPPKKKRSDDDDDNDDEEDHDEKTVAEQDAELGEVVTTDSEDESESGDGGAGGYSDNDGEDSSSSEYDSDDEEEEVEGSGSDSDSQPLADKPIAKNNQHTPTAKPGNAQGEQARPSGVRKLTEAETLAEFARPCCNDIERFRREHRALLTPSRMESIDADLQLLRTSKTAPGLMGAALSLARNLAAAHSDAPPDDAVPLGAVGRKRVRELAVQATDFSELTLARVNGAVEAGQKMLEELEDLRKRGRALLGSVESACASTTSSEPAASQEP